MEQPPSRKFLLSKLILDVKFYLIHDSIGNSSPENYNVLCAVLFTLELSTPLESEECVLSAYKITFLDMVSLQRKEQNYFVLCAF